MGLSGLQSSRNPLDARLARSWAAEGFAWLSITLARRTPALRSKAARDRDFTVAPGWIQMGVLTTSWKTETCQVSRLADPTIHRHPETRQVFAQVSLNAPDSNSTVDRMTALYSIGHALSHLRVLTFLPGSIPPACQARAGVGCVIHSPQQAAAPARCVFPA